jgi:hypothetical protein
MGAIERENPTLKGVLPRDYARPSLDTATPSVARILSAKVIGGTFAERKTTSGSADL